MCRVTFVVLIRPTCLRALSRSSSCSTVRSRFTSMTIRLTPIRVVGVLGTLDKEAQSRMPVLKHIMMLLPSLHAAPREPFDRRCARDDPEDISVGIANVTLDCTVRSCIRHRRRMVSLRRSTRRPQWDCCFSFHNRSTFSMHVPSAETANQPAENTAASAAQESNAQHAAQPPGERTTATTADSDSKTRLSLCLTGVS